MSRRLLVIFLLLTACSSSRESKNYSDSGDAALKSGRYSDAESMFTEAVREAELSGDQARLAAAANKLGAVQQAQGKHLNAEQNYRRALDTDEGRRDLETLDKMADFYSSRGRLEEAKGAEEKPLTIRQSGSDSSGTAATLGHLALVPFQQSCFKDAEYLLKRAPSVLEMAFGPEFPALFD